MQASKIGFGRNRSKAAALLLANGEGLGMANRKTARPLMAAGTMLGIGMGGFVDGIMLHQIAQVHAMLSAKVSMHTMAGMRTNMTADGWFHVFDWVATLIGITLLFRAGRRPDALWSGRILAGGMLFGWGLFNLVEGVIAHHLLGLHQFIQRLGPSAWDVAYLASGVVLMLAGWRLARSGNRT